MTELLSKPCIITINKLTNFEQSNNDGMIMAMERINDMAIRFSER